jgi:hypothetical protein
MPISYSIDPDAGLISEIWTGSVSARDLGAYWTAYLADPEVLALRRTLVDLRESTIGFSGREMSHLIDTIVTPALAGRSWQTAIVVAKPAQYGVSRQYQVFAEHYSRDAIFEDYETARLWLLEQERDPAGPRSS